MIWKSASTVLEELGASLISSYNTSKEKNIPKAVSEHSGLILGLFCDFNWNLNCDTFIECLPQFPSLKLDGCFLFFDMTFAQLKEKESGGIKHQNRPA